MSNWIWYWLPISPGFCNTVTSPARSSVAAPELVPPSIKSSSPKSPSPAESDAPPEPLPEPPPDPLPLPDPPTEPSNSASPDVSTGAGYIVPRKSSSIICITDVASWI